ncbi:MAG TPA: PAS domain-containing protein [Terriglobales bacterium]|nr:PAS domain-containing protein [Terriglobales bacterium]
MKEPVNILMVDDQPGKLLSYEAILGELGENLIKATSGKAALEELLKTDIAVVLMDVSMPELDGFELADMIRQHPRFQNTAIIFISAVHLTQSDQLRGYERGGVDYVAVPVVPELLRAKVRLFAELHRKSNQLERLNRQLEQRVEERTRELESKAAALENLNRDLAHKHQELDAIVRTAPDIIFSRQADGGRDYISDRFYEFTGAPSGSANGFGWTDMVHPDDRIRSMEEWMQSATSGQNYESEYRMRSKDGEYRWFRARAVPIRDHNGEILKWYGTCSDIHDSKVLEQSMRDNAMELEKTVAARTEDLRRLSGRLLTLRDEEQRRVARELHDGLGQELVAAKMTMDSALQQISTHSMQRALLDVSDMIDRAITQVRSISHLLHPPLLDEVGLLSAIQWYLDGLTKRSGIQTSLDITPTDFPRLAREVETAIFRIVQEALTNVFRHSGAHTAWVSLSQQKGQVIVRVRDDGKGIGDIPASQTAGIGVGIGGMRQRSREFGGDLRISDANPGTLVEAVIPYKAFDKLDIAIAATERPKVSVGKVSAD